MFAIQFLWSHEHAIVEERENTANNAGRIFDVTEGDVFTSK